MLCVELGMIPLHLLFPYHTTLRNEKLPIEGPAGDTRAKHTLQVHKMTCWVCQNVEEANTCLRFVPFLVLVSCNVENENNKQSSSLGLGKINLSTSEQMFETSKQAVFEAQIHQRDVIPT